MTAGVTYRPLGARIIAYVAAACCLAMFIVIAVALPAEVREGVTPGQLVTLLLILLGALGVLHGIGRTKVTTDSAGVHILNGFRRHDLEWAEVIAIEFGRGTPWAVIDTADGDVVKVMAIQSADGTRANKAVRHIRADLNRHG